MRKLSLLLLLLVFLMGCATGELMSRVRPGMAKDEVTNMLGNPDGYQKRGEYEALKFSNRLISGWSWDRADYYVILKEGKVVEYDPGEVRVKNVNSNVLFLVPLH
jgi:hypothetical protein